VFGIGIDAGGEASPFDDLLSYLGAAVAHWLPPVSHGIGPAATRQQVEPDIVPRNAYKNVHFSKRALPVLGRARKAESRA
jgi:hypothetical protein